MKNNKLFGFRIILLIGFCLNISAQHPLLQYFNGAKENIIQYPEALYPVFDRIREGNKIVRIVQIGDSHVRGHVFPMAIRTELEKGWGDKAVFHDPVNYNTTAIAHETGLSGVVFSAIGRNGATCATFTHADNMKEVARLHPDLIIISFGTNESHGRNYLAAEHHSQIGALTAMLQQYCPTSVLLFTTPPGSFISQRRTRNRRRKRNRYIKISNPHTVLASATITEFASGIKMPVWDLYSIAGGKEEACRNWKKLRFYRRDGVHFTEDGYTLQGRLLADAILKSYTEYITSNETKKE